MLTVVRYTTIALLIAQAVVTVNVYAEEEAGKEEFRQKLSQMLQRTEKSIKLLREQIVESQNAPFLPELYVQLAELLSQKSNSLYYIQMEIRSKTLSADPPSDKEFSPVVAAQKEAIARNPNSPLTHFQLAGIYSEIGREEEARAEAAEVLRLNPNFSLEVWRQRIHFKDPTIVERWLAAARKAGLK